ncbi:MAG TPA: 2-oxoacid:acceptor oxidoreductase family protein [Terriglobales bacterium]|nr:2-oxoacid:acceptor oxidoreductase family protein [Terriglobales bacterium]
MERSMLIAGFGGQGVQTLGKLLTYTANEEELFVTFYPSYGAEMRGGTSNCTVVFSDSEIAAPYRSSVDCVVALNQPSYATFFKSVRPGGTFLMNSNLIAETEGRDDIRIIGIPLNDMASEVGSPQVLNIILIGFLSEYLNGLSSESALAVVKKKLGKRKDLLELNIKAFNMGVELAKKQGKQ